MKKLLLLGALLFVVGCQKEPLTGDLKVDNPDPEAAMVLSTNPYPEFEALIVEDVIERTKQNLIKSNILSEDDAHLFVKKFKRYGHLIEIHMVVLGTSGTRLENPFLRGVRYPSSSNVNGDLFIRYNDTDGSFSWIYGDDEDKVDFK